MGRKVNIKIQAQVVWGFLLSMKIMEMINTIFIKNIIFINKCIIIPPLYLERFISLNFFNIY